MNFLDIIGLKISAIKGNTPENKKLKKVDVCYVLFDDGETYLELEEQDYYTYHDCSSVARLLNIYKDKEMWNALNMYPDSNYCSFMY